jgi:hypothetical protein
MLAGTAAGVPTAGAGAGTSPAAAGIPVWGEPRSVVGVAPAGTGPDSDGVVVETGSVVEPDSVGVGSDRQDAHPGSSLGPTLSPLGVGIVAGRCAGVGCGAGSVGAGSVGAGSVGAGSVGAGSVGAGSEGGGGSVPVGGVSIGGGVLTGGAVGVVGVGVGLSTTTFPLPIVGFSPVGGPGEEGCFFDEGCSFAQASLAARTKAERHKTSTTSRARGLLRLCRWARMAVFLCGCPRVKSLRTLPIVSR